MLKFDIAVIIYFFQSLFLLEVEGVVTSKFKNKVIQIMQQVNDNFSISNKPWGFRVHSFLSSCAVENLCINFTPCSSVSIVNFEHVIAGSGIIS